jgi:hypothetical protein
LVRMMAGGNSGPTNSGLADTIRSNVEEAFNSVGLPYTAPPNHAGMHPPSPLHGVDIALTPNPQL